MAEKAYRRGFQHGHEHSKDGITESMCSDFRYHTPITKNYGAPERYSNGKIFMVDNNKVMSVEDRHFLEHDKFRKVYEELEVFLADLKAT